jgi:hypothetical protein
VGKAEASRKKPINIKTKTPHRNSKNIVQNFALKIL